jgi:hypothetical protein
MKFQKRIPAILLVLLCFGTQTGTAQQQQPRVWTISELFTRNVGTTEQQNKQFPSHKIIGNVYYVGTESLATFLVTTPQGHILINTDYERNNAVIRDSITKLGFKVEDIKIILGSHAHGDHMEGDALLKQQTGAQVMAMAEDIPALQAMRPGGKEHPIDRTLHDGEQVKLGDMTLTAPADARTHQRLHHVDVQSSGRRPRLRCPYHRERGSETTEQISSGMLRRLRSTVRLSRYCTRSTSMFRWDRIRQCTAWPRNTRSLRQADPIPSSIPRVFRTSSRFRKPRSITNSSGRKPRAHHRREVAAEEDAAPRINYFLGV